MNVNNGRRVDVVLPGYSGQAGLVEQDESDVISFPTGMRLIHAPAGTSVTVEGVPRIVRSMATSPFLRGYKVVELEKLP